MLRDSLGVPLEPEDKTLLTDWDDQSLYADDIVYPTEYGLVLDEQSELVNFLESISSGKTTVRNYMESLREG